MTSVSRCREMIAVSESEIRSGSRTHYRPDLSMR